MSRRSSSPEIPVPPGQVHATRRAGSRRDATERVRIRRDAFQTSGWTLNISRGGARLVLEEPVELGQHYQVEMGLEAEPRDVRIVWVQDEADGQIVGVQFLDVEGTIPPPPARKKSAAPHAKGASTAPPARGASTAPPVMGASTAPPVMGASTAPPVMGASTAPAQARTSRPPSTDPKRSRGASTAPPPSKPPKNRS